jgi:hypothetical protein
MRSLAFADDGEGRVQQAPAHGHEDSGNQAERQAIDTFLSLPTPQRLIVRDVVNAFALANGAVRSDKE